MKRFTRGVALIWFFAILLSIPSPARAEILKQSGKLTLLRVHDKGTLYGETGHEINVEVVIKLDSKPDMAFGFTLRDDDNRPAHQGMLDLLRDAFSDNRTVTIVYDIENPTKKNGEIVRAWLINKPTTPPISQYAVKFVCGKTLGDDGVAEGIYYTAINVHNPWSKKIAFKKKYAIAVREPEQGEHTPFYDVILRDDQAQEIDCEEIFKRTNDISTADLRTGFVVIESADELDVVAVYTAANMENGQVMTQHTERVPARRIFRKMPDLLPIPGQFGSFCRERGDKLFVVIKNQGAGVAEPSTTEVDFLDFGKFSLPTERIYPGQSKHLLFDTPPNFFSIMGHKNFHITADALFKVSETNEENNKVSGACIRIE
jgi:hypothetical protein